jgi:hypothetical protein
MNPALAMQTPGGGAAMPPPRPQRYPRSRLGPYYARKGTNGGYGELLHCAALRRLPTQIANKITPRRDAVATDRNGAEIRSGDTVREVHGNDIRCPHHRDTRVLGLGLIMQEKERTVDMANPALAMQTPGGGAAMPPPRRGRDHLIGKTVTIRKLGVRMSRGTCTGLLDV